MRTAKIFCSIVPVRAVSPQATIRLRGRQYIREFFFGSALLMVLSIHGCAAIPPNAPILTDRIYAISTVDPKSAKAVGVNYPRPIAVLGEKHTYIVGVGSDDIVKLASMVGGKAVLKDKKTLFLDGGRLWGSMDYEVIGAYSTSFQVSGVAIPPVPLNDVSLQAGTKIINFYKGSATTQPRPMQNASAPVLKAPLAAGAFLMWAVVDLTAATTGKP